MLSKEEIEKLILNTETYIHPLLNEIYAIRDRRKETQDYTIYVDGYISVDVLDKTLQLETENIDLKQSVEQIYDAYQDVGKLAFDYGDKIAELKKRTKQFNAK